MADKEPNKAAAEKLHKVITDQNVEIGDFDAFYNKLKADDGVDRLVSVLEKNNINIGSVDDVSKKLYSNDGTTPAEKKNEKPATVSPVGGGSSGLLSVKFGGEDYEVNPTTQQVFKGGKPVTVPAHIKDYIEKNIIGSKPKDKPAEKPYVAKGAVILPEDYFDKKAMPKETAWLISDLTGMDMTALQNSPQVVDEAFKDLSTYTGIAVDKTSNPETITKAIGQAKMLRDTKEFTKLAKDAGVTEKKALEIAYDNAADKFLDSGDKELWALTKQVNQAFEGGDKATVDKLMPVWEKARKQFIDNRHDKITSLHNMIITGKNVDGVPLTSAAIEDLKKEKNLLTKQLNGFFKSPEAVVKDVVGSTPMLSVFDKQLEGKTGQQKLETIAKPMLARYFLLGKKMGVKTEDIMGEGNTRFMQTDKTYLDDVKNYMGIGDYDGEVTSSDRKEFNDLHNKLGIIMPMLLINKIPIQDVEDKPVDILKKGALSMTPALATMNQTGQQKINTLDNILVLANITPDDLTQDALTSINTKMKKYGWAQDLAQMGGSTLSIMLPMMLAETGAGFAIESLALNPRTAMVANFLLKNPVGKVIKGGTTFSAAGKISDGEELDFGTGAASGVVEVVLDALGSRNITLAKWFINTFGKQATKYAAIAAKPLAKGTGEFFQESGETVYQAWRDTPEGKSVMETLQKQFPDADSRLKFFVGTTIMGGGMGLAGDIGFGGAKKRAYDALSPENKAKADAFMATRNQKAKDAVDEVVPVASNDAIEKNIKDAGEAKQKLQDIAKDVQSEDEVVTYSIEVDGVTYSGSTLQDLQRDIDFLDHVENTANDELYKRNTGQTETPPIAEADKTDVELAKPEAGVSVEGEVAPEPKGDIQTKQKETEAKIKRKDLFADGGTFANQLGGSGENSVPTNHREVNGIEFVEFSNPTTGIVDVVMTGTSDTDYVGYYRIYENGKPTNKWSSKFENQSRNKANFKTMISGAQQMLPQGHEYTEKTSISTDGLRVWGQQLERGYELQRDANGKLKTNRVAINGDAIENELGIPVNKGKFDNISVTNNADMKKVKSALLPYLQKFGLDENNIHFENGTVEIDLPVLKQTTTTQAAPTTTQESPINTANAPETTQNAQENGQQPHTAGYATIAADYLFTGGRDVILSTDYLLQAMIGSFQHAATAIDNIRNKYAAKLGNIKDDVGTDTYNKMMQEIRDAINNSYGNNADIEAIFDKILNSPTGFTFREGNALSQELDRLNDAYFSNNSAALETTEKMPQGVQVKETVSEKQVPPTETSENPALKNVASTATALSKLDKGTIDATLPMQPLEIDGYKREYRTDSPLSIAEAYHKAKADGSNPDLVKAVEELLAPKGESKKNNVTLQDGTTKTKSQKSDAAPIQQEKEADTEGTDTTARNEKKREAVKSDLKKLRDEGLLKTADKTLIGKAKKLLGVKSAPMSDAEIDAQMALLDAMADVWKKTTGKDNFYDTFIADIKKGNLAELKKMGGVLFQDTENPTKPISRVTLAVFEQPLFEKMKGSMVAPQAISDLVKSRGKQIEKDIINMVLDFDKYKGQKRISFDEFRNDVETQVMKLEKIRTQSYASYGYGNLGDNENYGDAETVILNSPIEHGQAGHFSGDFTGKGLEKKEWELKPIPNTDKWAAMDKNMPAGVTPDNIAEYVGTAGSKEEVEKWISDRDRENSEGINRGLFGHIRKWFNDRTGVFHIAELQSDYYQKNKAADLIKPVVSEDEVDAYMNKNVWMPLDQETADKIKNKWGITTKIDGNSIFAFDREGNKIAFLEISEPLKGLKKGEHEQQKIYTIALMNLAYQRLNDTKLEDGRIQVTTASTGTPIVKKEYFTTEQQAEQFIKLYDGRFNGAEADYDAIKAEYYANRRKLQQVEEQKFIQKRQEELAKDKPVNIQLKQFVASQKVHELRLLREAIKMAADEGAETVRFPSQYTLAVIEGYTDATGEGAAPYEIISGNSDRLYEGDIIDYGGERMIVVAQDRTSITVAPRDEVSVFNYSDLVDSETDNRVDEIEYEANRHFDDLDAITKEEVENYEPDEWMGDTAKTLLEAYFDENEDAETVKWDDIKSDLYDTVRDMYGDMQVQDLAPWSDTVWMDGDTIYALEGRNYETFNQPDEYEASSSKDDYYDNLSKEQKTVVDKYGELAEQFQKMRPDARTVVDDNGMEWLETDVTEADKNNPIVAFQEEGGKVKGAIDFTNDNRATLHIFDGADISTLAHEMSGHLGRRVLEKLAEANSDFAKQYEAAKKWAGVKDVWTTKAEEKFARGFEKYLREGKAPTTALKEVFGKLKEWLSGVYNTIKGSSIDIKLTDDVRNVFDTLLGKQMQAKAAPKKQDVEIASVFNSNPELAKIGTQQQYSQYLDSIFPNSKVTLSKKFADTYNIIFNGETIGTIDIPSDLEGDTISIGDVNIKPEFRGKGLGVETYKAAMKIAGKPLESFMATDEANRVWNSLIKQGLAKKTDTGFITISPLLGTKQDIDGFKEFVAKKSPKKAIQSDVIDKLVGNAANRREAYKEIADENIKEVAKIITDTNGKFDKVMDAIDNNDQLLADLEKKLGIKKICRI